MLTPVAASRGSQPLRTLLGCTRRGSPQRVVVEHVAHDQRDAAHVVPARLGRGVEVDAQLVGVVEVGAAMG